MLFGERSAKAVDSAGRRKRTNGERCWTFIVKRAATVGGSVNDRECQGRKESQSRAMAHEGDERTVDEGRTIEEVF